MVAVVNDIFKKKSLQVTWFVWIFKDYIIEFQFHL